jgi:hypothetical protein
VAGHRGPNTLKNLSPTDATSHLQSQPVKHHAILVVHLLFRPVPACGTSDGAPMWTGPADRVGRSDDLDLTVGVLGQRPVDSRHIGDEFGTVPFPAESLQAQERMASQADGGR